MAEIQQIHVCGLSDVGMTRSRNEDAFLIGNIVERSGFVSLRFDVKSLAMSEQGILCAVADGMGGQASGNVASRLALNVISRHYHSRTYLNATRDEAIETLTNSIMTAHRIVSEASAQKPDLRTMGTTVVGLNILGDRFFRFHAGDSRLYRFRDGHLEQLTKDHSLAQMLVDAGKLKPSEVATFSRKNEITNTVGASTDCKPEVAMLPADGVLPGDILLLCSDGLSNMMDLSETPEEFEMLNQLMEQINDREKELESMNQRLLTELEKKETELEELRCRVGDDKEVELKPIDPKADFSEYDETQEFVIDDIDSIMISSPPSPRNEELDANIEHFLNYFQGWQQKLRLFLSEKQQNPIEVVLKEPISLEEKARALIRLANDRKSRDNLTVILIELV